MTNARTKWEARWRAQAEQFAPARGRFNITEEGKRDTLRRNSRPRIIPDEFAAGLKSGLTSPTRPWFALGIFEPELSKYERVKAWLSDVTEAMLTVIGRSNFYDQIFTVYKEEGVFGTGCLYVDEDEKEVFRCQAYTVGQYAIGHDKNKLVNSFARSLSFTASQLALEFGEEKLPPEIRMVLSEERKGEAESSAAWEVRHLIEANDEYAPQAPGQRGMMYRSLYWLPSVTEPEFLRIGGYNEFPVMAPRWRLVGEDLYGSEHPGDVGLDDARSIQDIEMDERKALKLRIEPPLLAPKTLQDSEIDLRPGAVTYYDPDMAGAAPMVVPLIAANFDHAAAAEKIERLSILLEKAFYIDLFRMWASDLRQGRTATEIQAREEEKIYALEPVLTRQMYDLLDPFISRVYSIMERRGLLPPPPPELQGMPFKIEYTSVLAKSQKQSSQYGIETVLGVVGNIMQMQAADGSRPEILDKIDTDTIVDLYADMHGLPSGVVLGDDRVKEIREQKAEEQAAQQQMAMEAQAAQQAPELAGAAKDMSETQVGGGSAIDMLMGQMGGLTDAG
ncbi:phage head-tail connector protein [Synergistales bacterium]|nr:phage head-tail connector protein [Synergistales bacterium]